MLCQDCQEKMASILFTQIVDNKKTVLNLCKDCAKKRGLQISEKKTGDPINDFLAGMTDEEEAAKDGGEGLVCGNCGLTQKEFRTGGKLGCAQCYETFNEPLKKLLRKIHGNTMHHGKAPLRREPATSDTAPAGLEELKKALAEAVAQEAFEKAAELRDRIRAFENNGE